MPEKDKTDSDKNGKTGKDKRDSQRGLWIIIGIGAAAFLAVAAIGSLFIDSQKVHFITEFSLTVVLATLVGIQAYIYRQQWEVMDAQWDAMRQGLSRTDKVIEKMEAQLVAVKEQAEIMGKQAKSMDQSVVFGLRAYVGVRSITLDLQKKRIFLEIGNTGKVPAKNIKVQILLRVEIPEEFRKPEPFHFVEVQTGSDYGNTKLFPDTLPIKFVIRLDEDPMIASRLDLIAAGHARMIIRGNINFMDGFHSDKNTPFAFRYFLRDNLWSPYPVRGDDEEDSAS
jgi:hypothetical protein